MNESTQDDRSPNPSEDPNFVVSTEGVGDASAAAPVTSIRESLRKLTSESVIYGIGQVSGRAVQLLLVPILTRALTPGAYGVSELVFAYLQTALLVLVLGMDAALARFFYDVPDRDSRIRLASTSLAWRLVTGSVIAAIFVAAAGPVAGHLLGGEVYRKYLILGATSLPFALVVLFSNDVLRVTFQPGKFIALNVAWSLTVGGLALWLVLVRHLGVAGVLYGKLAGDALCAVLGLVLVRHTIAPRFDRAVLHRMLRFGLPLVPAAFAYGAIASVDRYVLQRSRGLEDVAVYSVAMKFFAVLTMAVSAFQLAYMPIAYARARHEDAPRFYARVFALYVGVSCWGALVVSLFAPEVLAVLVPAEYRRAAAPAVWLTFAAIAQGAYNVVGLGINLALRTGRVLWIAIGASLADVALNLWLTPRFGPSGAALATTGAHMASALLTYAIAQRVYPAPYRGRRLLAIAAMGMALAWGGQTFLPQGWSGVGWKVAIALLFLATLWRLRIWSHHGSVATT